MNKVKPFKSKFINLFVVILRNKFALTSYQFVWAEY
jgi:hypothetical protein